MAHNEQGESRTRAYDRRPQGLSDSVPADMRKTGTPAVQVTGVAARDNRNKPSSAIASGSSTGRRSRTANTTFAEVNHEPSVCQFKYRLVIRGNTFFRFSNHIFFIFFYLGYIYSGMKDSIAEMWTS